MSIEILTLEIGSTITKANAFRSGTGGGLTHVAQGFAPTSVAGGDVGAGVDRAVADLESRSGLDTGGAEVFVNSSAAGGLRMSVHGLTRGMTARAAHEAALGAGGVVTQVTAGPLGSSELEELFEARPNIVLLAGGVDHGERDVVLRNAELLAAAVGRLDPRPPVVYAGNVAARRQVQEVFAAAEVELMLAPNVFPDVDVLDVDPVRRLVHDVFNRHIVHAPGMARLRELSTWAILPTPGAVLLGAELFAEAVGDALVIDVGGATTDVHSVSDGSSEWTARTVDPEPRAKRTVEGDLGVYVNAANIVELAGDPLMQSALAGLEAIPATTRQQEFTRQLCRHAVTIGVRRHAGVVSDLYTSTGRKQVVRGKDLTAVRWVVGTGGALTRIEGGEAILRRICTGPGTHLLPPPEVRILIDRDYRFSALGTVAQAYPDLVRATFRLWVDSVRASGRP